LRSDGGFHLREPRAHYSADLLAPHSYVQDGGELDGAFRDLWCLDHGWRSLLSVSRSKEGHFDIGSHWRP
jgi:hypothetical protein